MTSKGGNSLALDAHRLSSLLGDNRLAVRSVFRLASPYRASSRPIATTEAMRGSGRIRLSEASDLLRLRDTRAAFQRAIGRWTLRAPGVVKVRGQDVT